jgi:hypothetical protein
MGKAISVASSFYRIVRKKRDYQIGQEPMVRVDQLILSFICICLAGFVAIDRIIVT